MARAASSTLPRKQSSGWSFPTVSVWLCATLCALHPVSSDLAWWELSKGREFVIGSWNPAAALVTGPLQADATWLSGVLPYFAFQFLGLSGLMGLKLAGVLMATACLLRRAGRMDAGGISSSTGAMLAAGIVAACQAWEPAPILFDTLGFLAVFVATEPTTTKGDVRRLLLIGILLCLWSNFGPRSAIGLGLGLWFVLRERPGLMKGLGWSLLLVVACCCTPATWRTLIDSFSILFPQGVEPTWVLTASGWTPWWNSPFRSDALAFLVLSLLYVVPICRIAPVHSLLVLVAVHFLAAASSENLPIAALGLLLTATSSQARAFDQGATTTSGKGEIAWNFSASRHWSGSLLLLMFLGIAVLPWRHCGNGLGWGLDGRLQSEAFAASVAEVGSEGSAHCVGWREAGLLCWYKAPRLKPYDTPATALLNGRLKEHVLLTSDLTRGWQVPHRRADASWGGWWNGARTRGLTALVVPSENLELITALEPTIWKPLSVNAVSLVYGKAGDTGCTPQIINVLSVRQMVDRGAWIYQAISENSGETFDLLEAIGLKSETYQSLRLARVFRAMQLHIAALKVLEGASRRRSREGIAEFHANQVALGYRERVDCGQSSELRLSAALLSLPSLSGRENLLQTLNWPSVRTMTADDGFGQAVQDYVDNNLGAALDRLPINTPEGLYAKALLLLERGDPTQAHQAMQAFLAAHPHHRLVPPLHKLTTLSQKKRSQSDRGVADVPRGWSGTENRLDEVEMSNLQACWMQISPIKTRFTEQTFSFCQQTIPSARLSDYISSVE